VCRSTREGGLVPALCEPCVPRTYSCL